MTFDDCFAAVIGSEGSFQNDRMDTGNWTGGQVGAGELKGTKFGISAASYPDLDISSLTVDQAKDIYLRDYWNRLRMDDLPKPMRYPLFDFAVNSGVGEAAESLQASVGAIRDGAIGDKTIALAQSTPLHQVLRGLFVERAMVFALSPNDRRYGRGWYARLFDVTEKSLQEVA